MSKQIFNPLLESNFQKLSEASVSVFVYRKGANTIAENNRGKIISVDTDMSIVLNASIATLSDGGIIFIRAGTYQLGGEITILYDGISIIGEGIDAVKLYTNDATANVFSLTTRTGTQFLNFSVYGNVVKTAGAFFNNIGSAHTYFDRLRIFDQFQAFYFEAVGMTWVENMYIRNCTPDATAPGSAVLYINGGTAIRLNNVVADAPVGSQPTTGIYIKGSIDGIWMTGCDIIHHSTGLRIAPYGAGEGVMWGFISDCSFDSSALNIALLIPTHPAYIKGFVFVDCWFSSAIYNGLVLYSDGVIDNVNFIGCRIINNGNHGVLIDNSARITNITFEANQICANSQMTNNAYSGVAINAAPTKIKLYNNKIGDISGMTNQQQYGVVFNGNPQNYIHVIQNDLSGNVTAGFAAVAFTNSLIMHNIGYNPQPLAAIAIGASPFTYTNNSGAIEQIRTLFVSTTAFNFIRAGVVTGIPFIAAHTMVIDLYPGDAVQWVYNAGAPNATRIPM